MNCTKCLKLIDDENKCDSDPAVCGDCCNCGDACGDDCCSPSTDEKTEEAEKVE